MARPLSEAFGNLNIRAGLGRTATLSSSSAASSASAAGMERSRKDRLIVGVDFGTTYSGVAAVYSGTPDDIEVLKTWPGGNGITSDKVPTEISYIQSPSRSLSTNTTASSPPSINNFAPPASGIRRRPLATAASYRWGFQPPPTSPRLRCLKLFLDRKHKLPSYVSPLETVTLLRSVNKTVLDAISDYLAALHTHTIDTLTRRYGESFMASTPIEWVLTVPAVWSDAAKDATRIAAERAGMAAGKDGIDGIKLISEPEAAAVYTLRAIQPNSLAVGDHFVVCDAGGGTVDLISYEITSLSPSLLLSESSIGTGGLCGSVFLNYAFEDHCRRRLGEATYNGLKSKTQQVGLKYWDEYVKRNFRYTPVSEEEEEEEEEEISVPFPGLPDDETKRVEGGFLMLRREEVKEIFEPVVGEVVNLCEEQVESIRRKGGKVTGIVLVGGFGQSNYLYSRLKEHFSNSDMSLPYAQMSRSCTAKTPTIEVMQPLYAWTAVVRGAVIRGLEGSMVVMRKARCHYGTSYATVWEETKHSVSDRYWSPLWERWMVSDRMQWHIERGQPVSERAPISFHYTRNFRPGQALIVEDELMMCELEIAPTNMSEEVHSVCTLKTDLSAVPKSEFTRLMTSNGEEYMNLDFVLELIVDSASLMFELKVEGVAYGSVTTTFHS